MAMPRLAIYLDDHGSTAGIELARRMRKSNAGYRVFGEPLAHICAEIEADRAELKRAIERAEGQLAPVDELRRLAAVAIER